MQHGKSYRKAADLIDRSALYSPAGAVRLPKQTTPVKFDATAEVPIRLAANPPKATRRVRATVNLPPGTAKTVPSIASAPAKKAATPDQMAKIGRIARILGPRGLMPNPKTGTVTMDVAKAITDIRGGKIAFRVDKHANLHLIIGKASFTEAQLIDNYAAVLDEVLRSKPAAAKGKYLRKVFLATTMGPGIPVDPNRTRNLLEEEAAANA